MQNIRWYLIIFALANLALAECPPPLKVAESFYTHNYDFYYTDPAKLKASVTPEFLKLLQREAKYTSNHTELGSVDYDPWLGAQDGEIGKPLNFKIESQSSGSATVLISYPFLFDGRPSEKHTVRLVLHSNGQGCWLLHDFVTATGESLSDVYSSIKP